MSVFYFSAAVASIPLSRVATAIGPLRMMRLGCLTMGILLVVCAGFVRSVFVLAVVLALAGIVSAGIQPATNLFLIRQIPSQHQGLAFGVKQAAAPLSVMLGGLSVPAVALTVGWRWAFVVAAMLAFVTSILLPRAPTGFVSYRARPRVEGLSRRARLHLALLACGFAAGVASASALSAFIVPAAVATGGGDVVAGLLASLGGLLAASTRIGVGLRADHSVKAHLDTVIWMLGIGAIGYGILALSSSGVPQLLVPGVVLAFSFGWGWNGLFNQAVSARYPLQAAQATGITAVGGMIGGVIGPALYGFMVAHSSYTYAWLSAAVVAVIGAAIIVVTRGLADL